MDAKDHDVYVDLAGLGGGYDRLTCKSCGTPGLGVCVIRQPYMSDAEFRRAALEFLGQHPTTKRIKDDDHRGRTLSMQQLYDRLRLN